MRADNLSKRACSPINTLYTKDMRPYFTLLVFGILIFFLPFLGFPSSWKTVFLFLAGLVISGIALSRILTMRAFHPHENREDTHSAQLHETQG